jgi:hypothetical protein
MPKVLHPQENRCSTYTYMLVDKVERLILFTDWSFVAKYHLRYYC